MCISLNLYAQDCVDTNGTYGNNKSYQSLKCMDSIASYKIDDDTYRSVIFNKSGMLQVNNNVKAPTVSLSLGARVFFLVPKRTENKILKADEDSLLVQTTSGAVIKFEKDGTMTSNSPDLKIKHSRVINNNNKGGIEIESYNKGLVIDLGWRLGNSPMLKPEQPVKITDKNGKICNLLNKDIIIQTAKYEAEPRFKTNDSLHAFLQKRCPDLDISDLKEKDEIGDLIKKLDKKDKGEANKERDEIGELIKRLEKEKAPQVRDELGELIEKLERDAKVNNTERKNAIKEESPDNKNHAVKPSGREK